MNSLKIDGEKLRDILLEKCINPATLASKADVSIDTILRLIKGKCGNNTKFQTVGRIAKALAVKPQELLID